MMRQQAISAIHAKMLRLNSASIAAVSVGKVRPVLFACQVMRGHTSTAFLNPFPKPVGTQHDSASFSILHEPSIQ